MLRTFLSLLLGCFCFALNAQIQLRFDAKPEARTLLMADGSTIRFTAYEGLFFVTEVEDSTYQTLNIYVPEGATRQSPIFLRTYIGGYMASMASAPQADDASGRALKEGFVVVIPGSRGRNSVITADKAYAKAHKGVKRGDKVYTGRAPKGLLDLKAAVRYLRHFDAEIPGNKERIVCDGTSAGGAMSSLLGATGNHPAFEPLLAAMGAANERDDVFCAVCFCPITDLEHADMAYEWLYGQTDSRQQLDATHRAYSDTLAAQFPAYFNSLNLRKSDGSALTSDNLLDAIKQEIIRAAQIAKNAGASIPDTIGFSFSNPPQAMFTAPLNGGVMPQGERPMLQRRGGSKQQGEYITDLDMSKYLNYVVSTQALKGVPAFDSLIEGVNSASGENDEFGNSTGSSVNFTDFTAQQNHTTVSADVRHLVTLMNPLPYVKDPKATTAPHWYIRHGARDRDTSFPVAFSLATLLENTGRDVNFLMAWNRPHSGDYALDELFDWLRGVVF